MLLSPLRSNCLVWALHRRLTRGGVISIRKSRHLAIVPHFLWSRRPGFPTWSYCPRHIPKQAWIIIVKIWFCGDVKLGP